MLKANVMRVQQQTNSVDCGILAMAFLILFDEDPKTQRFDEKLLQESLLQMLAEQCIRCFQTTENNVVKCKSKSISLDLYCSCRQPCFSKDAIVENKQIAFRLWLVSEMVLSNVRTLPQEIFEDGSIEWNCLSCSF